LFCYTAKAPRGELLLEFANTKATQIEWICSAAENLWNLPAKATQMDFILLSSETFWILPTPKHLANTKAIDCTLLAAHRKLLDFTSQFDCILFCRTANSFEFAIKSD
jgi:D-alanyl-D-alanine dipeptidase